MASDTSVCRDEAEVSQRQPTLNDLMVKIDSLCLGAGLSYHQSAPVSVSPGVWMFYANRRDDPCLKHGSCRQQQFFAYAINGELKLT